MLAGFQPSANIDRPSVDEGSRTTREVKKPRLSLTTMGVFLIFSTKSNARARASSLVCLPRDDLDQRHLVDGREEVQADEVLRRFAALARPVIGSVEVLEQISAPVGERFGLLGDCGLELAVLEDRLDDHVAARERLRGARRCVMRARTSSAAVSVMLPLRDRLVEELRGVGLARLGFFLRHVSSARTDAAARAVT